MNASWLSLRSCLLLALVLLVAGCGGDDESGGDDTSTGSTTDTATTGSTGAEEPTSAQPPRLQLVEVGTFDRPVHAVAVPGGDQVAVVEQGGRIRIASGMTCAARDNCPAKPVTTGTVVLDIADEISSQGEQGLLGLAFHPDWPDDPRIFVDFTDRDGATHVEAWNLASASARATRAKELLRIEQPFANHNGGHLAFGPDGLLYVAMGDGGSGGDPGDRAQSDEELLGKLLRIDVDGGGERGYAIPRGNLRADSPVWAVGLRNPWRFSFDAETGDLWIGDVGQDEREEIDALPKASLAGAKVPNFEWRQREGFVEFDDSGKTGPGTMTPPVLDYGRDDGCSVTGGVVYRGEGIPALDGWYVFADFCKDDLRLLRADGVPGSAPKEGELRYASQEGAGGVVSFGTTARGELLVVSNDGPIRQLVAAR